MTEREINEMAEQLPPPPSSIPIEFVEGRRTRKSQPLKWYEKQWGSGFLAGLWAGLPLAMGIAAVCKWFLGWLFTF